MTTPTQSSLPTHDVLLNASSLKLSHCSRHYNMVVVRGLVSKELHENLAFGKAIHRYAELRNNGGDAANSLALALDYYKGEHAAQLANATLTMPTMPWTPYVEADGRRYVELKFKVFWKTIVYQGHAFNIYICGTFDLVTMFADGAVRILDFKSTRLWKAADVFAQYRMSVQMQFYAWAAMKFGHHIFDMTVANQTTRGNLFVQIMAIFISKTPIVWTLGSPIQASMQQLTDFENLLDSHIEEFLLPAWLDPRPDGMVNDTCAKCEFAEYCFASSATAQEAELSRFKHVAYDPMNF